MAYTRKYFLNRVKAVNELYMEHTLTGATNEWIYKNLIRDTFHISRSTFYEYLTIPYMDQIRKIDERERENKRCNPTLF